MLKKYILLIDCPDEKGLVYRITEKLYRHSLNIISNGEFVDPQRKHFFMRTEFTGDFDRELLSDALRAVLPERARIQLVRQRAKKIVILATREPHCLGDLLLRYACEGLNARICAVISNHAILEPLVRKFELPYHWLPHTGKSREEHEAQLLELIRDYEPEYMVLAKYMRILSADFVSHYANRIVNIHHSFLPAFAGANPYGQAYERGVKIIGATAHFVTEDLDGGPIIAQSVIPVDHTHSAERMAQAGRDVEKVVLGRALKLVFEERVFVSGNRTILFD